MFVKVNDAKVQKIKSLNKYLVFIRSGRHIYHYIFPFDDYVSAEEMCKEITSLEFVETSHWKRESKEAHPSTYMKKIKKQYSKRIIENVETTKQGNVYSNCDAYKNAVNNLLVNGYDKDCLSNGEEVLTSGEKVKTLYLDGRKVILGLYK